MLKILQARFQQYLNGELPDVLAGFIKDRGTRSQISNIHWIIEKTREFKKNSYCFFIDCTKAFDCVDHNKLENSSRDGNKRPPYFSSAEFSCSVMSDSLWPQGLQHARLSYPAPTPGAYSNSCPSSQYYHSMILSSIIPFSCLQLFPASGSFLVSQFFPSCGQSIRVSASTSVLPINIQDWYPLGLTSAISLQSKWYSRVFSNTTV